MRVTTRQLSHAIFRMGRCHGSVRGSSEINAMPAKQLNRLIRAGWIRFSTLNFPFLLGMCVWGELYHFRSNLIYVVNLRVYGVYKVDFRYNRFVASESEQDTEMVEQLPEKRLAAYQTVRDLIESRVRSGEMGSREYEDFQAIQFSARILAELGLCREWESISGVPLWSQGGDVKTDIVTHLSSERLRKMEEGLGGERLKDTLEAVKLVRADLEFFCKYCSILYDSCSEAGVESWQLNRLRSHFRETSQMISRSDRRDNSSRLFMESGPELLLYCAEGVWPDDIGKLASLYFATGYLAQELREQAGQLGRDVYRKATELVEAKLMDKFNGEVVKTAGDRGCPVDQLERINKEAESRLGPIDEGGQSVGSLVEDVADAANIEADRQRIPLYMGYVDVGILQRVLPLISNSGEVSYQVIGVQVAPAPELIGGYVEARIEEIQKRLEALRAPKVLRDGGLGDAGENAEEIKRLTDEAFWLLKFRQGQFRNVPTQGLDWGMPDAPSRMLVLDMMKRRGRLYKEAFEARDMMDVEAIRLMFIEIGIGAKYYYREQIRRMLEEDPMILRRDNTNSPLESLIADCWSITEYLIDWIWETRRMGSFSRG